jgi:tetratricopeptide (TPR) repeat protein
VLARIDSYSADAYALLADVQAKRGDPTQAMVQIERAIERTALADRDRHVQFVLMKAAMLRRMGTSRAAQEALLALATLTEEEQYRPEVMDAKALSYAMLDQPLAAGNLYADALFFDPLNAELAVKACEWYLKAGDQPRARAMFQKLLSINTAHPRAMDLRQRIEPRPQ